MRIAIKLLSDSDLSLFEGHSAHGGRRDVELDDNVVSGRFYPDLRRLYEQVGISLVIVGPGLGSAHRLTRRLHRARASSDWCLGGELVHAPADESGRYDTLAAGDYGIFAFDGAARPTVVTLALVSAQRDPHLHEAITVRCGSAARNGMVAVSELLIAELRAFSGGAYCGEHPLDVFGFRGTVEEVLFGNTASAQDPERPSGSSMSHADLRQQLLSAAEAVQWGKELFWRWLVASGHSEEEFEWFSQMHVRSVFDYEVRSARWIDGTPRVFVCVKSTGGPFERPLHMSVGELRFAVRMGNCRIARLYGVDGESVRIRVLAGVEAVAERVLKSLEALPPGAVAESFQIEPAMFAVEWEGGLA